MHHLSFEGAPSFSVALKSLHYNRCTTIPTIVAASASAAAAAAASSDDASPSIPLAPPLIFHLYTAAKTVKMKGNGGGAVGERERPKVQLRVSPG